MRKIYTGIDLGSFGIKIVVSEYVNGKFQVLAATNVRSKGVKNGLIVDLNEASISLSKAKKNIEDMLGIEMNQAIVSVPNDGIKFDIVSGEISLEQDKMVSTDEITSVFHEASIGKIPSDMELATILPISFHIDGKEGIKDPKGMVGNKLSVKAVITMIPKYFYNQVLQLFKSCEIQVVDVCFPSLGDYYEARTKETDHEVVAIANIGYDSIDVSVFNKGIMIKNEKIDAGSKLIDADIARNYQVKRGIARFLKESFAVSNTRYADISDTIEVNNKNGEAITINQLEISEVVETRLIELLKLAKKQISILTNREISYIIITGGISELAGFQYVVENIFDRRCSTLNIGTIGVRSNVYSSALGMIKYFHYKLELRGNSYSMFNETQTENLVSTKKKVTSNSNDNIISKVFGYFSGE